MIIVYILQISDLHINNETNESYIRKKLVLLNKELNGGNVYEDNLE